MTDLEKAKEAIESKKYHEAIAYLSFVISSDSPEMEEARQIAYRNRGVAHGILGEYENALDDLNQALEMCSEDVLALSNRAMVHKDMGNVVLSIMDCKTALDMPGGDEIPTPYFCLGELHFKVGNSDEAIRNYIQAYHLAQKVDDHDLENVILERIKNTGLLSKLSPLLEKDPGSSLPS